MHVTQNMRVLSCRDLPARIERFRRASACRGLAGRQSHGDSSRWMIIKIECQTDQSIGDGFHLLLQLYSLQEITRSLAFDR